MRARKLRTLPHAENFDLNLSLTQGSGLQIKGVNREWICIV